MKAIPEYPCAQIVISFVYKWHIILRQYQFIGTIMLTLCVLLFCGWLNTPHAQELLQNRDFENGNSISPWQCQDCQAHIITSDKYHGHSSVQVTNRFVK
jgi:hypothetical protein